MKRIKNISIILLVLLSFAVNGQERDIVSISNSITPDHVSVPSTRVALIPPKGFEGATTFNGFQQKDNKKCTIMVFELQGAFSEYKSSATSLQLLKKGISLTGREEMRFDNYDASLSEMTIGKNGSSVLAFGDDSLTVMILASYPLDLGEGQQEIMKKSIMSAAYMANTPISSFINVGFKVNTEGTPFKLATAGTKDLLYTVGGKITKEHTDNSIFIVSRFPIKEKIADKKVFCTNRLENSPNYTQVKVEKTNPVNINGLEGYEVYARATDLGEEVQLYVVTVFDNKNIYVMHGAAHSQFEENLRFFNEISKTFGLE